MARHSLLKVSAIIGSVAILLVAAAGIHLRHANQTSAIATASLWARVAPLPASVQNLQVGVEGSMFTREFVITFNATPSDIQRWIAASPGPASARRSVSGTITTYAITPGGDAEFAEVKVDSSSGKVVIHSYWG